MLNHGIQLLCLLALLGCSTNGAEIEKGSGDLLKLYRYGKPQVPIGDDAVVSPGATVEILCNVNTIPEEIILINWEIDGEQLSFDNFNTVGYPNIRRYTERTLTIYNISSADEAIYTCVLVDSQTGEELDRADSMLQVTPDCPEGCQGENGGKGFVGLRGLEGKQGRAGYPGVCYPEECPNPQMGEKGEPGSQGNNGEEGEMGIEGEKGVAGDNGTKGIAGDNGENGDMGDKGAKGELGDQGENGEKGIKGAEGDEGIRGGEGDKGMKGEKGEQGITTSGPSGEVGDQGPQGDRGEQGTTGTTGVVGEKGGPGERGVRGTKGSKGVTGTGGEKGMIGKNLLILSINSTYNNNCSNYEKGQIIYDTTIGKFIFCDGNQFQCIPDKPCREDCKDDDPTINTINPNIPAQCVNLIYVIDESASMKPEQQWLRDVANAIPRELRRINYNPGVCMNNFGILGFGTGEEASRAEQIGRPIDLGGIITPEDQTFVPLWGSTSEVIRVINEGVFAGAGRREDGFAALYRALQRYTFVGVGCRKMLLITDEDRDNETPSPDPPYDRVPTLFNLNMQQILNQFSITLSAVISIQFQAQNDQQPNINYDTILGLLPNDSVIYYDENSQRNYSVASDGYVRRDSAAGNTEQTYFQQVRASGGIAWSLQASRTYRDAFTSAFLQFEIIPHVPQNNSTQSSGGCMLDSCNACPCVDGERYCQQIDNLDFNTTIKCRPTECNQTQIISGFRQPACIDMVFAFSETKTMAAEHNSIRIVAFNLAMNLAKINFGQENSICPNTYCLVGFGSENDRNPDQCYTNSFSIPPNNQLCAASDQIGNLILGLSLTATGNGSDGYAAIYTALQTHQANFQSQSCRHITLVTDTNRLDCGSYTDGSISIPQLSINNIESVLRDTNVVLNVIVNATFQDRFGTEALGIYQETDGSIVAVIPDSTAPFGFSTSPGGNVSLAGDQVEEDYIDLAIILGGSAWDIRKMGEQANLFTKAFVQVVVIKSSESCGQTRACVECKCVGGELQRCEESTVCNITGEVPILAYTSGNVTVSMDNLVIQVGGYGSTEEVVNYGIDGDIVNTFTLNTRLRKGTVPVNITWYYVTEGGQMVPIEDSPVARYVSVPQNNPYNLVFSQVGDAIQGSYLVVAENAYGRDTQLTNIGILPKWDKTLTDFVKGSEASLGQTLFGRFGSELRITGTVREGEEPWSFRWYYNGMEIVEGGDYSFEISGNQATIVINSFKSSDIGAYTVNVSNNHGEDTHTFSLNVISCANNTSGNPITCDTCRFVMNDTVEVKFFIHSEFFLQALKWYRKLKNETGTRELVATRDPVIGVNILSEKGNMDFCEYIYEVDILNYGTLNFKCECKSCSIAGEELGCCENGTFLYNKDEEGVDVMLVLDATEDMASANSFIFETLLPDLEATLLENSVGIKADSRNQYIITVLDQNENEPFQSTLLMGFFSFSAQNMTNLIRAYDEFNSTDFKNNNNNGRGAYGAVKSVLGRSARPTLNRILIVNTNKRRNITIYSQADWRRSSYYDRDDNGRSIFSNELSHEKIQPILIVNANLVNNETSKSCLGVSDLLECFYNSSGRIKRVHGNLTTKTEGNLDLSDIHQDFVIPGLTGGGHVWDIKAIIEGTSYARGNISESIVGSVVPRVKGKCNHCSCFNGKADCKPGTNEEQRSCQCQLIHGAKVCECQGLGVDSNCKVSPGKCRCDSSTDCCRN